MSVREHSWTTKDGETRKAWLVQYSTADLDARGKRRRHVKFFKRKRDADAYEARVRVDVAAGVHVAASKSITVAQAGQSWLDACDRLERATVDSYRNHLELHIRPYLGGIRLSALTVATVRSWQDKLRKGVAAPGEAEGSARSPDMIRRVTISLGALLADAQERGLVATNVVRSLKAARKRQQERRAKGKLRVGIDIPSPEEIDAILKAAKGRWRPLLLVAIRCGLRASELRGMRWADVDFRRAELHVQRRADKYNQIANPKSVAGERRIPIPPATLAALREWRLSYPRPFTGKLDEEGGRIREPHSSEHYIFPNGIGGIESHTNIINRGLIPTLIAAGVVTKGGRAKYTGLHAFRHYFASWCINRKVDGGLELPLKLVSSRLGHSSIALTADLYGHIFASGEDRGALAAAEGKHG